jgi:anaerobic magnesium-protoporphyrin IX monomethyl ester cyclase
MRYRPDGSLLTFGANGRMVELSPIMDDTTHFKWRDGRDAGMIDCLLIGFNDYDFTSYVQMLRSMGMNSGAYQDARLAFIEYNGRPYRALDILSHLHDPAAPEDRPVFHNSDFLWPVITYLGTYLDRHGFTFDYINLFHRQKEELRQKLENEEIRSIAITTTLYVSIHPIVDIVSFIREYNTDVKIIIGGPHIANQSSSEQTDLEPLFDLLGGDIYVIGREGELTLTRILGALRKDGDLSAIANLAYRTGEGFIFTPKLVESNALDENMVDYSLFPASEFGQFVTTRTAKSCPFSCAFCGFPQRAGKYTYLDLDHVERELDNIARIPGVSTITFIDDTFNVPKVRFREILQLMIRKEYGFKWNCYYRSDHGNNDTIRMMKEAGCEGVFLGVESGSDAILKNMNKTARRKHYAEALSTFHDVGISSYASLIVGFPGETEETIADTVDFLEREQPDFFRAQLWYSDEVTPIWAQRDKYGIQGTGFKWTHNTMDSATACQAIDHIFRSSFESIWMPQFGFEQWSTFYLQRKGMPMEQIKRFLRAFNAIVVEQLRAPGQIRISPHLLDELQATARFADTPA